MVIITGGAYQGKEAFARKLLAERGIADPICADGATAAEADILQADLLLNLHSWIARLLKAEQDPYENLEKLITSNPDRIITVNELGCGIVPMEAFDRKWRETTGRVCCEAAKQASAVYRVICGLGTQIK